MSIWGSLIGGMIGLSLGGPIGMLLGSILGGKISRAQARGGFRDKLESKDFCSLFNCFICKT